MKVALVQCPAWGALPPLGAATLKAYLLENDVEAKCFDFNIEFFHAEQRARGADASGAYGGIDPWGAESYDQWGLHVDASWGRVPEIRFLDGSMYNDRPLPVAQWADEVLSWSPDVIGFSVYITSLASSLLLAREISERRPDVLIVFGGPHVARDQSGNLALRTGIPHVVVDGEGEGALLDVVRRIEDGDSDFADIEGTGVLVDGETRWAPKRPLIAKIDTLPYPDFRDFDWERYENPYLIPIMASRGCVLDCAFCYETVYWRRFRTQGPERIADEMTYQVQNHPLRERAAQDGKYFYFMFADSLVNGHLGGLRRMADLLIERDLGVYWGGQATINTKMDAAFFDKLHRSGCTGLAFGLESGSQRVLDSMGKHFHIDEAVGFIKAAHGAGVTVTANVMVGYPNETFRDFLQTLKFIARTRRSLYQVSNVTTTQIALGSALHAHPERYGVTVHPNGTWTSEETGDDFTRNRRLRILHLWMSLLRVPHQEMAPAHREHQRERRRERRRSSNRVRSTPASEDSAGSGWLPFAATGPGPRNDEPTRFLSAEPFAILGVDAAGVIAVDRWTRTPPFELERSEVHGNTFDAIARTVDRAFGATLAMEWPDADDHEQLLVRGVDAAGTSRFVASAVPRRSGDGTLIGARFVLWIEPIGQPVTLLPRSGATPSSGLPDGDR